MFRTRKTRLDPGALCTPGAGGVHTTGDRPRPPPAASQRPAPVTLDCDPPQDVMITRHQQGFTVVHPMPAFPSPVTPDGTGILGLYPELHTRLSRTQQRMSGRGRAWTLPGLRPWHQPASFDALTHHVRPHVAAIDHLVAGRDTAPAGLGKPGRPSPPPSVPPRSQVTPAQEGHQPDPLNHTRHQELPPPAVCPQNPAAIEGQGADSATPRFSHHRPGQP